MDANNTSMVWAPILINTLYSPYHIRLHWRGAVKVFRPARPGSICLLAVGVYVIFSDHTFVALLASEASFNPVAKKITRISHVVYLIPEMSQRYEYQIWYMHFAVHHTRLRGRSAGKGWTRLRPSSSSFGQTGLCSVITRVYTTPTFAYEYFSLDITNVDAIRKPECVFPPRFICGTPIF